MRKPKNYFNSTKSIASVGLFACMVLFAFSQSIAQSSVGSHSARTPKQVAKKRSTQLKKKASPSLRGNYVLYDDMFLPSLTVKSASPLNVRLWTNGILPIVFDSNVNVTQQQAFFAACAWWSGVANIACRQRSAEPNFILVRAADGNNSYVGSIGGQQVLNLFNWNIAGIIAHEIGHAMGMIHEHMRYDRDNYIRIQYANIKPSAVHNFQRINSINWSYYDYESIMHYGAYTFSNGAGPTIVPIDPVAASNMGQQTHLSRRDELGAMKMYGASATAPLATVPNILDTSLSSAGMRLKVDFGLQLEVLTGPTKGKYVKWNICESQIDEPFVIFQQPIAGTQLPFGSKIQVKTVMHTEYINNPPPKGRICP